MQERVQKILARAGVASRRQAENLITQGRVRVNGEICRLGDTADQQTDEITLDGSPVGPPPEFTYILLNKPRGYVSTASDERGRKTVLDLIDCPRRVYPVGRLDLDSEGLLLLTNDGELTNRLLHPSHEIPKTYLVWLIHADRKRLLALGQPMELEGYPIRPAETEVLWLDGDKAQVRLTIREGRNRQIRKMAEQCGMHVTRLRRIAEGPLTLKNLEKGSWRYLEPAEIQSLKSLLDGKNE